MDPDDELICPLCGETRTVRETDLERVVAEGSSNPMNAARWAARILAGGWRGWGCAPCVRAERVLRADISRQTSTGLPMEMHYYLDETRHCARCDEDYVFDRFEKRYWYEELSIPTEVVPKHCASCRAIVRREKRAHRGLAEELADLDPDDVEQLTRIAELYEQLGSEGKAGEFRRRAENVRRDGTRSTRSRSTRSRRG